MLKVSRRQPALPDLQHINPLADPGHAYGVGTELTETGMWLRIQHEDGRSDAAFVSAAWLRWLAASSVTARAEGFELMKQRSCRLEPARR